MLTAQVQTATWTYFNDVRATEQMTELVCRAVEPLRDEFIVDAITMLDYGYAAFEVVWQVARFHDRQYYMPVRLKPLLPDITFALLHDQTGEFAGLRNANVDLTERMKALWLCIGNPLDRFTGVGYGRSQLENIRRLWQRWTDGEAVPDINRLLYDGYLQTTAGGTLPTVQTVVDECRVALNRVVGHVLTLNFGDDLQSAVGIEANLHVAFPVAHGATKSVDPDNAGVSAAQALARVTKLQEPAGKPDTVASGVRRGRLKKGESEAKKSQMLAKIREHDSLKFDIPELVRIVRVSESTVRRWLKEEDTKYRNSRVANAHRNEE